MRNKRTQLSIVFVVATALGFLATFFALFFTKGAIWNKIFFLDSRDSGMDFFHSIEYLRGRSPYEMWGTLYPPLANFFFWLLFKFVPSWQFEKWPNTFSDSVAARGTSVDLRTYQPTFVMFIIFVVIASILTLVLIQKAMEENKDATLIAISCLLSYNILYAFERGNIIILVILCCLFFVLYRKSSNKILSELSLLALAFAAGLKIYPAFLGVLLICDRDWKKIVRTVIYGVVLFFGPFLLFKEGFAGLPIFLSKVFNRTGGSSWKATGFSFERMFNNMTCMYEEMFHVQIFKDELLKNTFRTNACSSLVCLVAAMLLKKEWQKVLATVLAILFFSSQGIYGMGLLLIPLIIMMRSEDKFNKENIVPYICILNACVMLPIVEMTNHTYSLKDFRFQLGMFVLFLYVVYMAGKNVLVFFLNRKRKQMSEL